MCFGSAGPDCINGTPGPDSIFGLGGDDCICGEEGDDIIIGAAGNDFIFGGPDSDGIAGGSGDDQLFGDDGSDEIDGDEGSDLILGGAGDDTISGGPEGDTIFGQSGADTIRGDAGEDDIDGGSGDDQLFGGDDADQLSGGDGNDTVNGEGGDDTQLDGNDGDDTINGGPGNDTANGGPGIDTINGGADNDILFGGTDPDIIGGDAGDDQLFGETGNDRLDGGTGTDELSGGGPGIENVCINGTPVDLFCGLLTSASVDSLSAFLDRGEVIVRWDTSSESGTMGFRLERQVNGAWVQLHDELLVGLLSSPQGGTYDFRDSTADPAEPLQYRLVEVDLHGLQSTYGPYTVEANAEGESLLGDADLYARAPHRQSSTAVVRKSNDGPRQSPGLAVALYLGVERTGLYTIAASEIASGLGLTASEVAGEILAGGVLLTEGGESVAWVPGPDGSSISFVGLERESLYATERLYRLSMAPGDAMTQRSAAAGPIAANLTHDATVHLEQNEVPGILVVSDPDEDYWFWQAIVGGDAMPTSAEATFPLESVQGGGEIRIRLHGIYEIPHEVDVRLNGVLLGRLAFEGRVPFEGTLEVPPTALFEGDNTLTLSPIPGGPSYEITGANGRETTVFSAVWFDAADLTYRRGYEASSTPLNFRAEEAGSVELTGLAAGGTRVFDITDPRQPIELVGLPPGIGSIALAVEPGVEYLAVSATPLVATSTWQDVESDLRSNDNEADYLIIAPPSLIDGVDDLAAYRVNDGFKVKTIELQDVFDEFADGYPDPNAIRAFFAYALENWDTPPGYAVLVGKGSFDYREILGPANSFFPPIMAKGFDGLHAADNRYAAVLGDDGVPDLALGRLPVTSIEELSSLTAQIVEYESRFDEISDGLTLFAGDPDGQERREFGAAQDEVLATLPDRWEATTVYRVEFGSTDETRDALFDSIADSPRIVSYLGHGGSTQLGLNEVLFSLDDVDSLSVEGPQPLWAIMTCDSSRFDVPGQVSLSESLLLAEEGAIAVWGPANRSENEPAAALEQALLTELNAGNESRLGPIVNRSFEAVDDTELNTKLTQLYHLFGDPALRVAKVDDSPGTGGTGGAGPGGSAGTGATGGGTGSNGGTGGCAAAGSMPSSGLGLVGLALALLGLRRRRRQ